MGGWYGVNWLFMFYNLLQTSRQFLSTWLVPHVFRAPCFLFLLLFFCLCLLFFLLPFFLCPLPFFLCPLPFFLCPLPFFLCPFAFFLPEKDNLYGPTEHYFNYWSMWSYESSFAKFLIRYIALRIIIGNGGISTITPTKYPSQKTIPIPPS